MYKINISKATPVNSGLYGGQTLEGLVDEAGLATHNIVPVTKTLFMDMFAYGWNASLDKIEGLAIINDSTIAVCNDNDYGQNSPAQNGIPVATGNAGHVVVYKLRGNSKLKDYVAPSFNIMAGKTGPSTSSTPYLQGVAKGVEFTSILTTGEYINNYRMCGTPDGMGAYDNGDGTFTVLLNHEFNNSAGVVRAHGQKGAFVSKWVINKSDLSVLSGEDLIKTVYLWDGNAYTGYNAGSPSSSAAMSRFCSADLPDATAFYNSKTGRGTIQRIFMNGEEAGSGGRAFGHIATGPNAGS